MKDIASVVSYVRKNAGLSRAKLASLLDVSERTIKNWETGVSKPDAELFLQMFYTCNQHLINVMRSMDSPELFNDDSVTGEEIRQRLIAMIRTETTDEMNRKLLYNLSADHGSDAQAQLNLCTAYNHLPMDDKYIVCSMIMERYRMREKQGNLIRTEYNVQPDMDYLREELNRVWKEITK